jgi:hypothetical protein
VVRRVDLPHGQPGTSFIVRCELRSEAERTRVPDSWAANDEELCFFAALRRPLTSYPQQGVRAWRQLSGSWRYTMPTAYILGT